MEKVICACAKAEDLYISEWCNYHLNLGFDRIFIYDNSDTKSQSLDKYVNDDRVEFIPAYGDSREGFQFICYNEFYKLHVFDWCAFIDIDEFIVLDKPLEEFLNSFPNDCMAIKLNGHIYGDDDIIERDTSIPLTVGITKRMKGHAYEHNGKQIVRGGIKGLDIKSSHWFSVNGMPLSNCYQADYTVNNGKLFEYRNNESCYINHYITKTLKEFVEQKLNLSDVYFKSKSRSMDYYGKVNKITKDKLDWLTKQNILK